MFVCSLVAVARVFRIAAARIPSRLLPRLVASASPLGVICPVLGARWCVSPSLTVHGCVGDHPASVFATDPGEGQLSISIGTSSQLSRVARTPPSASVEHASSHEAVSTDKAAPSTVATLSPPSSSSSAVERRPYVFPFHHSTLLLCASLNGGNVLQTFVQGVERAVRELSGGEESTNVADDQLAKRIDALFARLIREATALMEQQKSSTSSSTSLSPPSTRSSLPLCDARFFGERSEEGARGALSNLSFPLFDPAQPAGGLGAVFFALCRGVISNLRAMIDGGERVSFSSTAALPPLMLRDLQSIRCVGAAMQRNPLLPHFASEVFDVPPSRVVLSSPLDHHGDADAAHGAALLALDWTARLEPSWRSTNQPAAAQF